MKIKKCLSIILVSCLLMNGLFTSEIIAEAQNIGKEEIIYYEGKGYTTTFENNGDYTIKSLEDGKNSGSITLHADGSADAFIKNNLSIEKYKLKFHEFHNKSINVDVFKNDKKLKNYTSADDLNYDNYAGQTVFYEVLIYSLTLFLYLLLVVMAATVIAGVVYYAVSTVIESVKNRENNGTFYYNALLIGQDVFINFVYPISKDTAVGLIQVGLSIYTYFSTAAQFVVSETSYGCLPYPEIDSIRRLGNIYYFHYHTANRNGAHAWFGFPYTL